MYLIVKYMTEIMAALTRSVKYSTIEPAEPHPPEPPRAGRLSPWGRAGRPG